MILHQVFGLQQYRDQVTFNCSVSCPCMGNSSVRVWATRLANSRLPFMRENMSVVSVINAHTPKDVTITNLIRELVVVSMRYNILFASKHVPKKKLTLSPMPYPLSRTRPRTRGLLGSIATQTICRRNSYLGEQCRRLHCSIFGSFYPGDVFAVGNPVT